MLDENDSRPLFLEKIYKIKLPERERPEKERATKRDPVYRVIASDRDDGPNAEISYSIEEGDENGKFFIEPKTGLVSSKKFSSAGEYDILTVSDPATHSSLFVSPLLLISLINVGSNLLTFTRNRTRTVCFIWCAGTAKVAFSCHTRRQFPVIEAPHQEVEAQKNGSQKLFCHWGFENRTER